jgi:hypothetical protein
LQRLKKSSVSTLKVYIYLCSRNEGKAFAAPIPEIAGATGLHPRSICGGLKKLVKFRLIERKAGRGSRPNQYSIPLPFGQPTAPAPGVKSVRAKTPVTPAKPTRNVIDVINDEVADRESASCTEVHHD